jgi:hypothetical protein
VLLAFLPFLPSFLTNPHRFCFSGDVEGVKTTNQSTLKTEKRTRQKTKGRKNKPPKATKKQSKCTTLPLAAGVVLLSSPFYGESNKKGHKNKPKQFTARREKGEKSL